MNDKENIFVRFLKLVGLIKERPVSKGEMCRQGQDVCNYDCDACAWNERKEE